MATIIQDDRTPEQKETHVYAVVGTDRLMSGWGKATDGTSYAGWACANREELDRTFEWVSNLCGMQRVRIVNLNDYRATNAKHFHIYVVRNPGEPLRI
tara:strand:- start:678 stop:971 length:294 start_codon:yes stop_codon:yes gene_type:complete